MSLAYAAFCDPAGGSGADSMTLALAHLEVRDGRTVGVLDAVRERRPPFSPTEVVQEFAALLAQYRVTRVVGDAYAGAWPSEAFRQHGVTYERSPAPKSDLYRELLPHLNSGRVELLDDARLLNQLANLERRTARGGRDSIDHGPGAHDDLANAAAGALVTVLAWAVGQCPVRGCDFEDCGGSDAPPWLLLGSSESARWEALHFPDEPDAAADEIEPEEAIEVAPADWPTGIGPDCRPTLSPLSHLTQFARQVREGVAAAAEAVTAPVRRVRGRLRAEANDLAAVAKDAKAAIHAGRVTYRAMGPRATEADRAELARLRDEARARESADHIRRTIAKTGWWRPGD